MKKTIYISAALAVLILIMLFSGVFDFNGSTKKAIAAGNHEYTSGDYQKAMDIYKKGLEKNPGNYELNYNLGQAAYQLKSYQEAAGYFDKASPDKLERYLNSGNCSLKLGDAGSDDNQKLQNYQKALQAYQQGIIKFPREVSLKYNYEYVKKKIEQLQQDSGQNQQSNEDQQNGENQQSGQNQQSGEDQQGGEDQQNSQSQQDGEQQQNGQDQQGGEDQQNGEDQQGNQSQQGSGEQQNGDQQNNETAAGQQGEDGENEGLQSGQTGEEIEQALEALEKQEEDSLKNNQGQKNNDKEDKYDW